MSSSMHKTVFCKDCEYYKEDKCWHPSNLVATYKEYAPLEPPETLNSSNDCQYYKQVATKTVEMMCVIIIVIVILVTLAVGLSSILVPTLTNYFL